MLSLSVETSGCAYFLDRTVVYNPKLTQNIQPGDVGRMSQVGLNMGPRHARAIGWAKSYTKNLDHETKVQHDQDVIDAVSFVWGLAQKLMPQEVIETTKSRLNALSMPTLRTQNVPEGKIFRLPYNRL